MATEIKEVEYFNITIDGNAAEAYKLLSAFAEVGIGLLAFKAIPVNNNRTKFTLFPNDGSMMNDRAKKTGLNLEGLFTALIIKSNSDEPGECADIFKKLSHVNLNIIESCGIADIQESYGVVIYLNREDCEKALAALKA